jgi:predicted unusual protein kinase regulating ubiquinone biosynthesis (AarF/ABC1/UbiB family)
VGAAGSPEGGRPTRGRLAQSARLAALPVAHVGRAAEAVAAHVQQRTAEQLFATLGDLKGGATKVGQAMSAMAPGADP